MPFGSLLAITMVIFFALEWLTFAVWRKIMIIVVVATPITPVCLEPLFYLELNTD